MQLAQEMHAETLQKREEELEARELHLLEREISVIIQVRGQWFVVCVKSMFVQLPFSVVVRLFQSLKFTSSCQLATKQKKTSPQSPVQFGHQNLKRKCLFIQTNMVMQWQSLILSCTCGSLVTTSGPVV